MLPLSPIDNCGPEDTHGAGLYGKLDGAVGDILAIGVHRPGVVVRRLQPQSPGAPNLHCRVAHVASGEHLR